MHELGHNLGLRHGGQDDCNKKPNYISMMNYNYLDEHSPGLITPPSGGMRIFDYSSTKFDPLDETALYEREGVGVNKVIADGWEIRWIVIASGKLKRVEEVQNSSSGLDWNQNRSIEHVPYGMELNNFDPKCPPGPLKSFTDWDNLKYGGGAIGGLAIDESRLFTVYETENVPSVGELFPEFWFDGEVTKTIDVDADSADTLKLVLTNGGRSDTYEIIASSKQGWLSQGRFQSNVSIPSGDSLQVEIPLTIPADAGPLDEITITVRSETAEYAHNEYTVLAIRDRIAPTIDDIVVASSEWSSEYVEQLVSGGFSLLDSQAVLSSVELNIITATFSEDVPVFEDDLKFTGASAAKPEIINFTYDPIEQGVTRTAHVEAVVEPRVSSLLSVVLAEKMGSFV
jgi:hypothetical protein